MGVGTRTKNEKKNEKVCYAQGKVYARIMVYIGMYSQVSWRLCGGIVAIVRRNRGDCRTRAQRGNSCDRAPSAITCRSNPAVWTGSLLSVF